MSTADSINRKRPKEYSQLKSGIPFQPQQSSPVYTAGAAGDYEPHAKVTPSSRTSTLRRGTGGLSATGGDYHKAYTAVTSTASPVGASHHLHHQQQQQHHHQSAALYDAIGVITPPSAAGTAAERPEYLSFERHTLDYRLNGGTSGTSGTSSKPPMDHGGPPATQPRGNGVPPSRLANPADFAGTANGGHAEYAAGTGAPTPPPSGAATALLLQQRINQSTATLQRLQQHAHSSAAAAASGASGTTSRQSRNHIITDTLPGPESCV